MLCTPIVTAHKPAYQNGKLTLATNIPMGTSVYINGLLKATATSGIIGIPPFIPIHFVLPKPLFMVHIFVPHDGEISYGSKTVLSQGLEQSVLLSKVYTCTDTLPQFPGKATKFLPFGLYSDWMSMIAIVLPLERPVLVVGPQVPH